MSARQSGRIYNTPSGAPFLKSLASSLMSREVCEFEHLSDVQILLPTRRACRSLQYAFLDFQDGQAMILPQLQPLGDVDEQALSLLLSASKGRFSFPPSISPVRRQILLARLIMARGDFDQGYDKALALANELASFMDQVYTESLDFEKLAGIVPDEFADHWRITLDFLQILSDVWPKILEEEGVIDAADKRNRLLLALAEYWRENPVQNPVIVAGTTGSIPATAELIKSVVAMPRGIVVLPGLDQDMDEKSWSCLDETHPQYGMQHLLGHLSYEREDVAVLSGAEASSRSVARAALAREVMRPAETCGQWAALSDDGRSEELQSSYQGLSLYVCDHEQEEADVISVLLRESLELEGRKACVVTADRALAARISTACKRWGVEVDDSAGFSLAKSQIGDFVLRVFAVYSHHAAPNDVLALLQHPYVRLGMDREAYICARSSLDRALRGYKPASGFQGLKAHIERAERLPEDVRIQALDILEVLAEIFEPLTAFGSRFSFSGMLRAHLRVCEALALGNDGFENGEIKSILWDGAEGREASVFLSELMLQGHAVAGELDASEYRGVIETFMNSVTLRPAFGMHPRVQILGQIEARMIDADLVILAGLNEGVWPNDGGSDPWMSRPMRQEFGLPGMERSIGLAAHDFVQGLCHEQVVITRSKRSGSSPSVPSRWLQRLDAVMQAAGGRLEILEGGDALSWARGLDYASEFMPVGRPDPRPPLAARPKRLSVTKIETWLRDPYSIYAGFVLGLNPLDDLEKASDAALRGNFVHDVMEVFVAKYPNELPADAKQELLNIGRDVLKGYGGDEHVWTLWMPRFDKICDWLAEHERLWREDFESRPMLQEVKGECVVCDDFVLSGRVDRIDRLPDGSAAIIDYKTGGAYSKKRMDSGGFPQLPLEAYMLKTGGFKVVKPMETSCLSYWVVSGGRNAGKESRFDSGIDDIVHNVIEAFKELILRFNDDSTPYLSLPRPSDVPRFNDYLHLARVMEWAALDDVEGEAA